MTLDLRKTGPRTDAKILYPSISCDHKIWIVVKYDFFLDLNPSTTRNHIDLMERTFHPYRKITDVRYL